MSNPLEDVLPAKVRRILYAVLFIAALAWGCYEAADGDWVKFAGGLVVALFGAMAHGNTKDPSQDPDQTL